MKKIQLHPITPQKRLMREVANYLNRDALILFPSDSGYTLGCSVHSKKALKRLYQLKKSEKKYQMSILFHDFSQISKFAHVDNRAFKYMKPLLPGPYTFLLPATHHGKKLLDVKRSEMGIRLPDSVFMQAILEFFPDPMITTTPRLDKGDSIQMIEDIDNFFLSQVDYVIDFGEIVHQSSTIVSLLNEEPELIREGAGSLDF